MCHFPFFLRSCFLCLLNVALTPISFFFFFNDTATTEIYTLSLHDALPICLEISQRLLLRGMSLGDHPLGGLLRQLLVVDHFLVIRMEVVLAEDHPLDDDALRPQHLAHPEIGRAHV